MSNAGEEHSGKQLPVYRDAVVSMDTTLFTSENAIFSARPTRLSWNERMQKTEFS